MAFKLVSNIVFGKQNQFFFSFSQNRGWFKKLATLFSRIIWLNIFFGKNFVKLRDIGVLEVGYTHLRTSGWLFHTYSL